MPLLVANTSDHTIILRSFDGDSVNVPPKVKRHHEITVDDKFDWQIPEGVVILERIAAPTPPAPPAPVPEPAIVTRD